MRRNTGGFSLIETLLVIGLITIVTGLALPVARSLQTRNDVDVAKIAIAQNLRQAQLLASAGNQDDNWGVSVTAGNIVLYRGASYAARVSSYDQITKMPATITPSGLSDINFTKITGNPSSSGTITLTGLNGKVATLTINPKGMVNY